MKKRNCRIAGLQMVSGPNVAENLIAATRLIEEAVYQGAQLIVLPEYFPIIGAADADRLRAREAFGRGPIQEWLAETAIRHKLWIVAGSIPLEATVAEKMRNSCLVFNPEGKCVQRYDKLHLFSFTTEKEHYDEAATIEPGDVPAAINTPFGRIALSICYDLRFPELYRRLAPVDLILVVAAFTDTTGRAHWKTLLRARAIENQCYLLAAAQGGTHKSGRLTHGNSMIIDPWGEILDRKFKGSGIVIADLDHVRIGEIRKSLPALVHRKL